MHPEDEERLRSLNTDHHRRMGELKQSHIAQGMQAAVDYNDAQSRNWLCAKMSDASAALPDEGLRILELGAGDGRDIEYLEGRDGMGWLGRRARYSGVEIVTAAAAQLVGRGVVCCAVENLPEEWTGAFHLVYSRHVMEHVVDLAGALAAIRRVLAPGGIVGAVTPHFFPDTEPAHVTQQTIGQWLGHYARFGLSKAYSELRYYNCAEAHVVVTAPS